MSKLVNLDTMKTRRSHIFYPLLILVLFIIQANYPLYAENYETKQSVTIQGIIIDEYNEPLIGVNVREKQTTNGTISDFDGRFSLNVNSANTTLVFSYIGYREIELQAVANGDMRVIMKEDISTLDEVIVVGYATQKKATVAAAVSSVNNQDLVRSTSTTAAGALVGKISGITARQKSGVPGSATTIEIRNMGTPLYVIDGIMKPKSLK